MFTTMVKILMVYAGHRLISHCRAAFPSDLGAPLMSVVLSLSLHCAANIVICG